MSSDPQRALSAWRQFFGSDIADGDVREEIAASWTRSRAHAVDPKTPPLKQVDADDLAARQREHARLLAAIEPHLIHASSTMGEQDHCWMIFDRQGVILATEGWFDPSTHAVVRPVPGSDFSESSVGTHAVGLVIKALRPATVVCAEHYASAWHDSISMAAPLSVPGLGFVGGVALQSRAEHAGPHCLVLVSQMAFAVERELIEARAHAATTAEARAERDSRQRIARLQELTSSLADSTTQDEIAEISCRGALSVPRVCLAALWVADDAQAGTMRCLGADSHDDSVSARYAARRQPDPTRVPVDDSIPRLEITLRVGRREIGALVVEMTATTTGPDARRFDAADQLFLRALADQVAASLERTALQQAAERARANAEAAVERMTFLSTATEALASTLDYNRALSRIAELAAGRLADWCAVEILDGDTCTQLAVAHRDPAMVELAHRLRRKYPPRRDAGGGVYEVIATRRSLLYESITQEALDAAAYDDEHRRMTRALGIHSAVIVPMVARDRALGAITLVNSTAGRPLGPGDLAMAEELAQRAAIALDNARLFEDATRRARQQEIVSEFGHRALEAPPETLWEQAVRAVVDVLHVDAASVAECRDGRLQVVTTRGLADNLDGSELAPSRGTLVGYTHDHGALVVMEDIDDEHRFDVGLLRRFDIQSALAVPIPGPSAAYGVLSAFARERRAFGPSEAHFLTSMANVLGAALQQGAYRRELEAASRHKDEFLAMLAHELRNPLAAIQGAAALLTRGAERELLPREDRALAIVDRQIAHMVHLVDDLLDVSRVMRGKIELQMEAVDLVELACEVCNDHAESARTRGIELRFQRTGNASADVRVRGDRVRLVQVVGNLVNNAIKFTPTGGHVTVEVGADLDDEARVSVVDDGAGIDAEALGSIFEPFNQADRSLDRAAGGLGLGLSVVHGLVELHEGRVEVHSDGPGRGARFDVHLPMSTDRRTADAPEHVEVEPHAEPGVLRVLIVEDNLDAAEVLAELLELLGHSVTLAHDVPQAFDALERSRPDVVLCDIGLPGEMSGYDLARSLRDDPAWNSTWLVALTGYGSADDRQRALDSGFDAHLTKPVEVSVIETLLNDYAQRPRSS